MRDYAQVRGDGAIDAHVAGAALDLMGVDAAGLDRLDREILTTICERFSGGPVGLSTLAVAVAEESDTLEDVYEPYLLQRGLPPAHPARALRDRPCLPPSRARTARRSGRVVLSRRAQPTFSARITLSCGMAHLFICPNCGQRTSATDRTAGFRNQPKGCSKCGFGFLFELLDDYYPAPNAAFFVCDQQGRVIGCGRGSRELTGLSDEKVIGRPVRRRARPRLRRRAGSRRRGA